MSSGESPNREEWLGQLATRLSPLIDSCGLEIVPERLNLSVGFPSKGGLSKRRRIGECWHPEQAADGSVNILISPVISDPVEVASTLLHELIHAAVGPGHGHKGPFITLAKEVGFTKPWTSTPATEGLKARLEEILTHLPPYPHGALDAKAATNGSPKPQSIRMVKLECVKCGYILRTTRMWIEKGLPLCYCSGEIQETGKE